MPRRAGRSTCCTRNDIIHRDVTPGNLLLSKTADGDTQVLIADLGVAKSMIDAVGATMTAGTPSYMAPEQASGQHAAGPARRHLFADRGDLRDADRPSAVSWCAASPTSWREILRSLPKPIARRLGAPPTLDAVMLSGWPPTVIAVRQRHCSWPTRWEQLPTGWNEPGRMAERLAEG